MSQFTVFLSVYFVLIFGVHLLSFLRICKLIAPVLGPGRAVNFWLQIFLKKMERPMNKQFVLQSQTNLWPLVKPLLLFSGLAMFRDTFVHRWLDINSIKEWSIFHSVGRPSYFWSSWRAANSVSLSSVDQVNGMASFSSSSFIYNWVFWTSIMSEVIMTKSLWSGS